MNIYLIHVRKRDLQLILSSIFRDTVYGNVWGGDDTWPDVSSCQVPPPPPPPPHPINYLKIYISQYTTIYTYVLYTLLNSTFVYSISLHNIILDLIAL